MHARLCCASGRSTLHLPSSSSTAKFHLPDPLPPAPLPQDAFFTDYTAAHLRLSELGVEWDGEPATWTA